MEIGEVQRRHRRWTLANFDEHEAWEPILGATEELGEATEAFMAWLALAHASTSVGKMAHSYLKMRQGIRGTKEEHIAALRDGIGDTIMYLLDVCNTMGFDMEDIIAETWNEISNRDWKANPKTGK